jgi:hypothetical protein
MALRRLSGSRAQVDRRRELVRRGFTADAIRILNLSTEDELADVKRELFGGDDAPAATWMARL